jgi:hypothetical protein
MSLMDVLPGSVSNNKIVRDPNMNWPVSVICTGPCEIEPGSLTSDNGTGVNVPIDSNSESQDRA